jgi:hypothetical protein
MTQHRQASDQRPGLNDTSVQIHPRVLQWALITAVALTFGIAGASFWLSFAVLRDLAAMAGVGAGEAWVVPVVLDGAIVSTTVTAIALSNHDDERTVRGRRFVVAVLVVAAAASIAGNAYHAVLTATMLPAIVSAGIATIAPIALLAMTEVLAVVLRAPRNNRASSSGSGRRSIESTMASGSDAAPTLPAAIEDQDVAGVSAEPGLWPDSDVVDLDTLPPEVEQTVRLRHAHRGWSWARIGRETDGAVASTAMRRYRRWEEASARIPASSDKDHAGVH